MNRPLYKRLYSITRSYRRVQSPIEKYSMFNLNIPLTAFCMFALLSEDPILGKMLHTFIHFFPYLRDLTKGRLEACNIIIWSTYLYTWILLEPTHNSCRHFVKIIRLICTVFWPLFVWCFAFCSVGVIYILFFVFVARCRRKVVDHLFPFRMDAVLIFGICISTFINKCFAELGRRS